MQDQSHSAIGNSKHKTLVVLIVLLSLIIAYLLLCWQPKKPIDYNVAIEKFVNSGKRIGIADSEILYKNYVTKLKPALDSVQNTRIDREGKYEETEYMWMSLEYLKNYVSFLEAISHENDKDVSGLAIYLGAYNDDKKINEKEEKSPKRFGDYRGRLTTFFVPTYYDSNDKNSAEILKHKPFSIISNVKDSYKGKFIDLNLGSNNMKGKLGSNYNASTTTQSKFIMPLVTMFAADSNAGNELNTIPPK